MAKLSPTLKAQIRYASRTAAASRLRGKMTVARHHQDIVESRVAEAERQGHGDEAFEAEMEGVQLAESQFSASKYDVTGGLPKRDPGVKRSRVFWEKSSFDPHRRNLRRKIARHRKDDAQFHYPSSRVGSSSHTWKARIRADYKTKYGRDKQSARRRAKGRPLNPYSRFVKSHKGSGLTFSEIAKLWRKKKRAATTSTRLKRHVTKHTKKGTKMASNLIEALARELEKANEKKAPKTAKSKVRRELEKALYNAKLANKRAMSAAERAREAKEIEDEAARIWPSGDVSRRKKSGYQKFMKAAKAKGHSVKAARAAWHRLSDAAKKAWKTKKTRKSARKSHRDPGYGHATHARAHRARRHRARRHHRGHRDPY